MNVKKLAAVIVIALVAIAAVVLLMQPKAGSGALVDATNIKGAELRTLVAGGARLVDVRTAQEFSFGHIDGAENTPVTDIQVAAASWDKNAPVVVYCASGARSLNAAQYLAAQGFQKVYNLTDGLGSWDGQLVKGAASTAATTTAGGSTPPPVSSSGPAGSTGSGAGTGGGTTGSGTNVAGSSMAIMYEFSADG